MAALEGGGFNSSDNSRGGGGGPTGHTCTPVTPWNHIHKTLNIPDIISLFKSLHCLLRTVYAPVTHSAFAHLWSQIGIANIYFFFFLLIAATRETSFVHAISAAGVMYTLTKNCSMGDFDNCGCDDSRIRQTGTCLYGLHI